MAFFFTAFVTAWLHYHITTSNVDQQNSLKFGYCTVHVCIRACTNESETCSQEQCSTAPQVSKNSTSYLKYFLRNFCVSLCTVLTLKRSNSNKYKQDPTCDHGGSSQRTRGDDRNNKKLTPDQFPGNFRQPPLIHRHH